MTKTDNNFNISGWIAGKFVNSKLTPLFIIASLLAGWFAIEVIPREEEPQIVVPMVDVFVGMPGAGSEQIEQRAIRPLEKLLWEIPGVEYIYSSSGEEQGMATVRFKVGEDLERSLVKISEKLEHHKDRIPPGVLGPYVKNRTIDDVPFLALTFWSMRYDHFQLRRVAAQVMDEIKAIPDVSVTTLIGGMPRAVLVKPDPVKITGYSISPFEIYQALSQANRKFTSGDFVRHNIHVPLHAGGFLKSRSDVEELVVAIREGRPIRVTDLAEVCDSSDEIDRYTFIDFGSGAANNDSVLENPDDIRLAIAENSAPIPAVTLAIAKRRGTNAIVIGSQIRSKLEILKRTLIPSGVNIRVTRDYGATASEKASELFGSMRTAVILVMIILFLTLGIRTALVASISIPVTLALMMVSFISAGYTLNRITLFAMIFSIGLLTDDAVVVLENMLRHSKMQKNNGRSLADIAYDAVSEIGNPTVLANIAIVLGVMPMAFVSGMMGPYMSPIPVGTAAAAMLSLITAYIVAPWAAIRFLKGSEQNEAQSNADSPTLPVNTQADRNDVSLFDRFYRRIITPLIQKRRYRIVFSITALLLVIIAVLMIPLRLVKVKMLPFDNKSEFQVVIDMPEGSSLEETAAACKAISEKIKQVPEIADLELHVGLAGPHNFSGLVRHYFLRQGPNSADIQVNLVPKNKRERQSHEIALSVRSLITSIAEKYSANVKIVEVPPGPPVLQTLVMEIYGPNDKGRQELADEILKLMKATPGIVDIDIFREDDQEIVVFDVDQAKASLSGLSSEMIAGAIRMGVAGSMVGLMYMPEEREDVPLIIRFSRTSRLDYESIMQISLPSPVTGRPVPLSALVTPRKRLRDKTIFHKNLHPVIYITADIAGNEESPVYPILGLTGSISELKAPDGATVEQWHAQVPFDTTGNYAVKYDGEWQITIEVFRDLGLAFAAVMILIYILMVGWYQDFITPLGILMPVPFSLVGILPGHFLFGAFFTATSMIGFIAGAGIIVRNSLLLIDFIQVLKTQGMTYEDATIEASVIRFRPMVLTSLSTMIGATVMVFDPIFQGLGLAIVFGEVASTCLTRVAVPVIYYQIERLRGNT